uniref:CSON012968 protein n=1 Tax=Culicoides sonorensis TaxID=179676 RepID=A0A336MB28_CULSO
MKLNLKLKFLVQVGFLCHVIYGHPVNIIPCSNMTSSICELQSVFLESSEMEFLPSSRRPLNIDTLKITDSTIHTLTSGICDIFPNIEEMYLRKTLDLEMNKLTNLNNVDASDLMHLKTLWLTHNPLTDFKIENIPSSFLSLVYLQDTDIPCDRLKEIIEYANEKDITISTMSYNDDTNNNRDRSIELSEVDGILCIPQLEQTMEVQNTIEDDVAELKQDFTIMKEKLNDIENTLANLPSVTQKNLTELEAKVEFQLKSMSRFLELQNITNNIFLNKIEKLIEKHDDSDTYKTYDD